MELKKWHGVELCVVLDPPIKCEIKALLGQILTELYTRVRACVLLKLGRLFVLI